jgi:hypothetical protein
VLSEKRKTSSTTFKAGDPRTIEAARRGGKAYVASLRKASGGPYEGNVLDLLDAAELTGPTWRAWRTFLKAIFAIALDEAELSLFQRHTERAAPPPERVREAWMAVGRRGGKSRIMAIVAGFLGFSFDSSTLAPGERGVIPILAADRRQARQVFGYLRGLCSLGEFRPFVHRIMKESIELSNGVNIEVHTASYRTTRGYTCVAVVCDEIAFWRTDDGAANPDTDVLTALRPSMATVASAVLFAASSPYAARGELYRTVERSFGREDPRILVWNADTLSMNPAVPREVIAQAFEDDPVAAASEYGQDGRVQFRRDVEAFLDAEAVAAVTEPRRLELPPSRDTKYWAFVDPSGGSQDSMTLAIGHAEGDTAFLDAVRERRTTSSRSSQPCSRPTAFRASWATVTPANGFASSSRSTASCICRASARSRRSTASSLHP